MATRTRALAAARLPHQAVGVVVRQAACEHPAERQLQLGLVACPSEVAQLPDRRVRRQATPIISAKRSLTSDIRPLMSNCTMPTRRCPNSAVRPACDQRRRPTVWPSDCSVWLTRGSVARLMMSADTPRCRVGSAQFPSLHVDPASPAAGQAQPDDLPTGGRRRPEDARGFGDDVAVRTDELALVAADLHADQAGGPHPEQRRGRTVVQDHPSFLTDHEDGVGERIDERRDGLAGRERAQLPICGLRIEGGHGVLGSRRSTGSS